MKVAIFEEPGKMSVNEMPMPKIKKKKQMPLLELFVLVFVDQIYGGIVVLQSVKQDLL